MAFLRNTWYIAAWSDEITRKPLDRTLLNEPVLMYRKEDGTAIAIGNRCPHRFAPLHQGKLVGDQIQCPYHGLRFDVSGRCVFNPHGNGMIPSAAQVKSYPLVERHGAAWIWMGDASRADPAAIVDIERLTHSAPHEVMRGSFHIKAHYELVSDNLLDLGHVPYLHPFFVGDEDADGAGVSAMERELRQEGSTITAWLWSRDRKPPPLIQLLSEVPMNRADLRSHMRWDPPAVFQNDTGAAPAGSPEGTLGVSIPNVHLLVPETERTTHYFWAVYRNTHLDNAQVSEIARQGFSNAFVGEDEPMIESVQAMMGTTDLMSLRPVMLSSDAAPVRTRRVLAQLIAQEQSGLPGSGA